MVQRPPRSTLTATIFPFTPVFRSGPVVVEGAGSSIIINVPTGRYAHDRTTLALERSGDECVISDGGQLSALLMSDFGAIVDVMECAGAPFVAERGQIVARTSSQHVTEQIGRASCRERVCQYV